MRRGPYRFLTIAIGVIAFIGYAGWAVLTYWALQRVWINRPSAAGSVALLVGITLVVGYGSYRFGTAQAIAAVPGRQATPREWPRFFSRLRTICVRMELPLPTVLIADTGQPNAFAMRGPDDGVIVIDIALIRLLTPEELDAVIAHELAHLERYDGLVQTLAATGVQTFVLVLLLPLAPAILLLTGIGERRGVGAGPTDGLGARHCLATPTTARLAGFAGTPSRLVSVVRSLPSARVCR